MTTRLEPLVRRQPPGLQIALAGMWALAVAMGIGRFAFTPILPMMLSDAGLSVANGGLLASANYLGYLLGALAAMAARVRPSIAIRGGLITIGLVTIGMGWGGTFSVWVALRMLAGIASAWVLIHVSPWCLERLAPLGKPVLPGVVFAGVGAGIVVAGGFCLVLMHAHASSAQAWIILGIFSLAISAAIWPLFAADRDASSRHDGRPAQSTLAWDSAAVRLVICYGLFGFGYIIPATFLPVMASQVIHDPWIFGWSWPVFGGAAVVSTLAVAVMPRSISNRRLWVRNYLVMALGVALPALWPGIAGIMLAGLLVGGTFTVMTMIGLQEARAVAGQHATSLIAAMTAGFSIGQIAGPITAAYLVEVNGDFSGALLIASFCLVIGAYLLSRPERSKAAG